MKKRKMFIKNLEIIHDVLKTSNLFILLVRHVGKNYSTNKKIAHYCKYSFHSWISLIL